jgi:hypothetical protein
MKIFLVQIDTEDGEKYRYVFKEKPDEKEYKNLFFTENGINYEESDWNNCIRHSIFELEVIDLKKQLPHPCNFDHNGECLICDCWSSDCAWKRLLNEDYKYESKEELIKMFENEGLDMSKFK